MLIQVNTTNEEIVRSKFLRTLEAVNGYVAEANGDTQIGQDYSAAGVLSRMRHIQKTLRLDLDDLAANIKITAGA